MTSVGAWMLVEPGAGLSIELGLGSSDGGRWKEVHERHRSHRAHQQPGESCDA